MVVADPREKGVNMTSPADRNLDPPAGEKEVRVGVKGEAAENDTPLPERVYAPASSAYP